MGGGLGEGQKERRQYQYLYMMGLGLVTAKEHASLDCVHFVKTAPFPDSPQSGRCVTGAGTSPVPQKLQGA